MPRTITREQPDSATARELIDELEGALSPHYPAASRHGYSVEKLLRQGVAFFVVYDEGVAAGCGGVQLFGSEYAELKRMYVRPAFRGRGLAKVMIDHLARHAAAHGVTLLRLETGIHQREAIGLYERAGFKRIGPFGEYKPDPNSLFFEMPIAL